MARYSDVLLKYDYILGDWGYGQLRLKGFFDDRNQKSTYETKISTLQDYLYEYCNFGCAYFVLKKSRTCEAGVTCFIVERIISNRVWSHPIRTRYFLLPGRLLYLVTTEGSCSRHTNISFLRNGNMV